jgi:putative iron-regulated protein
VAALLGACGGDDGAAREAAVVRHYAAMMRANYQDAVASVEAFKTAVDAFVAAAGADGHAAAKQAWLDTRGVYGESEVSRFYGGPIDAIEGRIGAWPIDEAWVDYTVGDAMAGIINHPEIAPQVDQQTLAYYDGREGAENRALGFHTLEFLLWGQRPDQTQGPGERPHTDYVDGGTAANQDRRRSYLATATEMLLADLRQVEAGWDIADPASYASKLVAGPPRDGIAKMVQGFANMGITELLFERINNPYVTREGKDELSCFSENTYVDIVSNHAGVENAYLGRYHDLTGPSLSDLVRAKNPSLDERMRTQLQAVTDAIAAIPPPFDHAVLGDDSSEPRMKVKQAIDTYLVVYDLIGELTRTLGVRINIQP